MLRYDRGGSRGESLIEDIQIICPGLFYSSQVCDGHPTASTADLYVIMLKKWDTASVEDKNQYTELYNEAYKKYLLEVRSPTISVNLSHFNS